MAKADGDRPCASLAEGRMRCAREVRALVLLLAVAALALWLPAPAAAASVRPSAPPTLLLKTDRSGSTWLMRFAQVSHAWPKVRPRDDSTYTHLHQHLLAQHACACTYDVHADAAATLTLILPSPSLSLAQRRLPRSSTAACGPSAALSQHLVGSLRPLQSPLTCLQQNARRRRQRCVAWSQAEYTRACPTTHTRSTTCQLAYTLLTPTKMSRCRCALLCRLAC